MKTKKLTLSLSLLLFSIVFTNCTKDQQPEYNSTTKEIITNGKWTVDHFFVSQDLTAHYSNYEFIFLGNGSLTATSGNQKLSGNWSMIRDVNRNDVLSISINSGDPGLGEMNDRWKVTEKTMDKVSMDDYTNSKLSFKKL